MEKITINPPLFFLINSLRGIGYSLETAIADLIDNSIAANAKNISVNFVWNEGHPYIAINDDGDGMSDPELVSALNLAEKGVDFKRDPKDLGRFGLGLKTASFSQCKILSVVTKQNDILSSYRWDLNILEKATENILFLLRGPNNPMLPEVEHLNTVKHGTAVIWEDLDKIISRETSFDQFCDISGRVAAHLSMVFHRFLQKKNLSISVDGKKIKPWDPFPSTSPTIQYPEVTFGKDNHIVVQGFVLPHKDYFPSEAAYLEAGGQNGWISQQGFYVYRNDRMLVSGSWLGLGKPKLWIKDELHVLARIQINITSEDDFDWAIDVKKSTATPPVGVRMRLQLLGEHIREEARKVYVHRGKGRAGSKTLFEFAWIKENKKYRVNKKHSVIARILATLQDHKKDLNLLLRIIEESVPVERIWLDTAEQQTPTVQYSNKEIDEHIIPSIRETFKILIEEDCLEINEIQNMLQDIDPFSLYPEAVKRVAHSMKKEFKQ